MQLDLHQSMLTLMTCRASICTKQTAVPGFGRLNFWCGFSGLQTNQKTAAYSAHRWCEFAGSIFRQCLKCAAKVSRPLRQRKAIKPLLQQRHSSTRARISGAGSKKAARRPAADGGLHPPRHRTTFTRRARINKGNHYRRVRSGPRAPRLGGRPGRRLRAPIASEREGRRATLRQAGRGDRFTECRAPDDE